LLVPVGPGGDDGTTLSVDLARTGGLLIAGSPGSGRTTALNAFVAHLRMSGVPVLRVGRSAPAPDQLEEADAAENWLQSADAGGMDAWITTLDHRSGVVVVDDLGAPTEEPAISRLATMDPTGSVALLAAASPGCLSAHYQGPIASLRRSRSGLLLCPGPGDADLMGVRLPRTPVPVRPGSGWLVTSGVPERIQVARHRPRPDGGAGPAEAQSSSSSGLISWVANQASS
jgi:S-DNA-T family DNA segregation ATPase FtsK/SpoIIIE